MKVKVANPFNDKYTGRLYKVGEELDLSVERINEIVKKGGLIELLEVQSEPTEQNEQTEPHEEEQDTEPEPEEQPEQDELKTSGRRKRSK